LKHTNFRLFVFLVLTGLLIRGGGFSSLPLSANKGERPNVVFIAIDDLRPDIRSYGHPVGRTPNLDSFSRSALLFEQA
jgi:hypothetical protein